MADGEAPYNPAAAPAAVAGGGGGRGRGRGRGRGGGGVAIEGIAELDASLGRGAPVPPAGRGGKPLPKKEQQDFRGPAGLFKQGDWTCTVCGNVNWERRTTCNKCQNPKPNLASTDEVRLVWLERAERSTWPREKCCWAADSRRCFVPHARADDLLQTTSFASGYGC